MSQTQSPESQVGRRVGDTTQAILYSVDGLMKELIGQVELNKIKAYNNIKIKRHNNLKMTVKIGIYVVVWPPLNFALHFQKDHCNCCPPLHRESSAGRALLHCCVAHAHIPEENTHLKCSDYDWIDGYSKLRWMMDICVFIRLTLYIPRCWRPCWSQ